MAQGNKAAGRRGGKFHQKDAKRTSQQCYEGSGNTPTIPKKLAVDSFGTYEQYAFCRTVGMLRESPHHIRRLASGERERLGYHVANGNASPSICGEIPPGRANDMIIGVNLDFNSVCGECAWIYWNEISGKKKGPSNG